MPDKFMAETVTPKKKAAFHEGGAFQFAETGSEWHNQAQQALASLSFPSSREEYWKYSRVSKIKQLELERSDQEKATQEDVAFDLVFRNGSLVHNGLTLSELEVEEHNQIWQSIGQLEDHYFLALNAVAMTAGISIKVPAGLQLAHAIKIKVESSGQQKVAQPRISILWEKGSHADFVFEYSQNNGALCLTNLVVDGEMKANASGSVNQLQQPGEQNYLITQIDATQERDSRLEMNTLSINGTFIRNNINVLSGGENCETVMNGIYLPKGEEHMDNHTFVDHAYPHCRSEENYKGVLNDRSSGVFNGKVMVRQDAQKIEAFQSNQNILLSDDAGVNSKPELEIYADDVRCSHGSTTGQLDEEPLFYLQSRGIPADKAKQLLVEAFVYEVIGRMSVGDFKAQVQEVLEKRQEEELNR
ncbi:Fe-S cluster assembly protein SufD [bacterium SCSIO 12741]|nr:Fe-S cluster assembly protein SufD [bacterium SCSIO 12741]